MNLIKTSKIFPQPDNNGVSNMIDTTPQTTAQINAIALPLSGMLRNNSDLPGLVTYVGVFPTGTWQAFLMNA